MCPGFFQCIESMKPFFSSYCSLEAALAAHSYKGLLLDAYGVFWAGNEKGAFPGAVQTMQRLFAAGLIIGIMSNSTQLAQKEQAKYAAAGFLQGKHYHFLITSGDLAKKMFSSNQAPFPTPRKKYCLFCLPHPKYSSPSVLFEESPFSETEDPFQADFIYINCPHIGGQDQESVQVFRPMVERFLPSNRPMLCANPDRFAHEGSPSRIVVRQGSIAALYEEMGGKVVFMGKPFPQIYAYGFDQIQSISRVAKEDILMVGDTPETDIRGALASGIPSALITHTGIMGDRIQKQSSETIVTLLKEECPSILIERFALAE